MNQGGRRSRAPTSHYYGWSIVQNLTIELFDFIKNLTQTINIFSKVRQNKKNLIYAEMIKVPQQSFI
jgi:hypothetical protein